MRLLYSFLTLFFTLYHFYANAETCFAIGSGYREDNLKWNIAGSGGTPNVLSELKWKNIRMSSLSAAAFQSFCGLSISAEAEYGVIFDGISRDSDYFGNNRTFEYSRSYSDAKDGYAYDLSAGLGLNLGCFISPLVLCPQFGYSYHEQHFTMKNGRYVINELGDFLGSVNGLDSSYTAHWQGPWIGIDAYFNPYCPFAIIASFRANVLYYNARGHWNLRHDFIDDFRHYGLGYGLTGRLGVQYNVTNHFILGICASYQEFVVLEGRDRTDFIVAFEDKNGNIMAGVARGTLKLNRVFWDSFRLQAYLSVVF